MVTGSRPPPWDPLEEDGADFTPQSGFRSSCVNRNAPCPCGSGRKYKKCCGAGDRAAPTAAVTPPSAGESRGRRIARGLNAKITDACEQLVPPEELKAAVHRWTGTTEPVMEEGSPDEAMFIEYLLHDWRPNDGTGQTVLERFAQAEMRRLSPEERRQLSAWLFLRRRGLYEVESTSPATHVTTLRDRLVGDTVQVFDVTLAGKAQRGTLLIGSVFPCGSRLEMSGHLSQVPRDMRSRFEAWLRRERATWQEQRDLPEDRASWPRFFSERSAEIERAVTRIADTPPLVVLSTGEPAAHGYAVYSLSHRGGVRTALCSSPHLVDRGPAKGNEVKGDSFGWPHNDGDDPLPFARPIPDGDEEGRRVLMFRTSHIEPGAASESAIPKHEDIAMIYLGRNRLEVSAMSKERLDFVCSALEAELGAKLSLVRSQQATCDMIDDLWAKRAEPRHEKQWTRPEDPELRRLERDIGERFWREWIDLPVKALGGKTPREATKDARLRTELEALLRDFEEQARRSRGSGKLWTRGFAENVRRELGMQ